MELTKEDKLIILEQWQAAARIAEKQKLIDDYKRGILTSIGKLPQAEADAIVESEKAQLAAAIEAEK